MDFGQRIKEVRKERGLTQDQMVLRLGVSRQAVSNWENNRNLPDIELIISMAREFDLSLDQLILGDRSEMDNMAKKLIADASDARRERLNLMLVGGGSVALILGALCLSMKAWSVEYLDAAGVLHENFFLVPLAGVLLLCGFLAFLVAAINALFGVSKARKSGKSDGKWGKVAVSSLIVVALGIALFVLLWLGNSGVLS